MKHVTSRIRFVPGTNGGVVECSCGEVMSGRDLHDVFAQHRREQGLAISKLRRPSMFRGRTPFESRVATW